MPNKSALISILFFLYKSPGTTFPLRENVAVARLLRNPAMARWLSWLERRPVTAEVKGSSPFRVAVLVMSTCSFERTFAGVAELVDAQDLKSCGPNRPYRFDSGHRHFLIFMRAIITYVCVAQLDRASGYGPEGRGFESYHTRYARATKSAWQSVRATLGAVKSKKHGSEAECFFI